jgi:hypothetical protein
MVQVGYIQINSMNKLTQQYHQLIGSPKTRGLVLVILVVAIFALYYFIKINTKTQTPAIQTQPIITSVIKTKSIKEPFPTPSITIRWSNSSIKIPDALDSYSVDKKLASSENSNSIAEALGFNSVERQNKSSSTSIWKKDGRSLLINFDQNSIIYNADITPQKSSNKNTDESYLLAAKEIVTKMLSKDIANNLTVQDISYFKRENIYVVPSSVADGSLVRVS